MDRHPGPRMRRLLGGCLSVLMQGPCNAGHTGFRHRCPGSALEETARLLCEALCRTSAFSRCFMQRHGQAMHHNKLEHAPCT